MAVQRDGESVGGGWTGLGVAENLEPAGGVGGELCAGGTGQVETGRWGQ